MHYILDTGFFVISRYYYPKTFEPFWKKMDEAVKLGSISSVREVKKELERYGGEQIHLLKWIGSHTQIFTKPNSIEQSNIRKIFENHKFQNLITKDKMLEGGAFADPFVIAKAMVLPKSATVVTIEKPAKRDKKGKMQGAPKIPDICSYFKINCINPQEFMQQQNWRFS